MKPYGKYSPPRKCVQCGETFIAGKVDANCVRCAHCRNFRNDAIQVECGRCGESRAINASLYYSRIKPKLDADGTYICATCRHTLRNRAIREKKRGEEPTPFVPSAKETLEVPCGTIWRTRREQRCEVTWAHEGYCDHYLECRDLCARLNWEGWRRLEDPPMTHSKRREFAEYGV
jgi:hypothetical protein